jgi:hypothetical protein
MYAACVVVHLVMDDMVMKFSFANLDKRNSWAEICVLVGNSTYKLSSASWANLRDRNMSVSRVGMEPDSPSIVVPCSKEGVYRVSAWFENRDRWDLSPDTPSVKECADFSACVWHRATSPGGSDTSEEGESETSEDSAADEVSEDNQELL